MPKLVSSQSLGQSPLLKGLMELSEKLGKLDFVYVYDKLIVIKYITIL
jgi:hypothetical protein